MPVKGNFVKGEAICNKTGGAVPEVPGQKHEFVVQSLIDVLHKAQRDTEGFGKAREKVSGWLSGYCRSLREYLTAAASSVY